MTVAAWWNVRQAVTNPNGKLDRTALRALAGAEVDGDSFAAPTTKTEQAVATIWAEVLDRPHIGATDDFFASGGQSLLAVQVLARLQKRLGVRIPLRTLMDNSHLTDFAHAIDRIDKGD